MIGRHLITAVTFLGALAELVGILQCVRVQQASKKRAVWPDPPVVRLSRVKLDPGLLFGRHRNATDEDPRSLASSAAFLPWFSLVCLGFAMSSFTFTLSLAQRDETSGIYVFSLIFAGYMTLLGVSCLLLTRRARRLLARRGPLPLPVDPPLVLDPRDRRLGLSLTGLSIAFMLGGALPGSMVLDHLARILPWLVVSLILFVVGLVTNEFARRIRTGRVRPFGRRAPH